LYEYGAANKRSTILNAKTDSDKEADGDADDGSDNPPQGLQLKAVLVGDEQFLFGKDTSIETGRKDCILKAVLNSGETTDERVAALVLAMSDAGLHQLVRQFLLQNQALIEAASPGMHAYMHPPTQDTVLSPGSPLNPQHMFPSTDDHVAVAVDGEAGLEVASTPQDSQLQTTHQEEQTTRNKQRCHNRRASILESAQIHSLEKDSFDFKKNCLRRKNASGKAGQMAKSRQV
jgi:hypothetical protein